MELKYLGKIISYKVLRDFILNNNLSTEDTIFLHSKNFDDLVIEYKDTYNQSMPSPFEILKVYVEESKDEKVPIDRIGILRYKNIPYETLRFNGYEYKVEEIFHRCGHCGGLINNQGKTLEGVQWNRAANYLDHSSNPKIQHIWGDCCKQKK